MKVILGYADNVLENAKVEWPAADIIADHHDMTPDQWRELRKSGLGGSDAGAVMQMSKYGSPLTVCMDKTGRGEEFEGNEATEVGTILEPLIREHVIPQYLRQRDITNWTIEEAPFTYRSRQWPWMMANIDGYVIDDAGHQHGLEIKTGGSYQLKEWGGMDGDEIPESYYAQVQHYMAVTGAQWWLVFGLIGNRRLHRWIRRNDAFIADLVAEEEEAWRAIEDNDPLNFPAPIGLASEDDALRALTNPMTDEEAELDQIESIVDRYYTLGKEIKDMLEYKKEAQQLIRQALGTAKSGTTGRFEVTRVHYTKQQFEHGRFAKDHPEAITDYMREIEIDFPRVKEAK